MRSEPDRTGGSEKKKLIQINPEIIEGMAPLPDLDRIAACLSPPASFWVRLKEGVFVNLLAATLFLLATSLIGILLNMPPSHHAVGERTGQECGSDRDADGSRGHHPAINKINGTR